MSVPTLQSSPSPNILHRSREFRQAPSFGLKSPQKDLNVFTLLTISDIFSYPEGQSICQGKYSEENVARNYVGQAQEFVWMGLVLKQIPNSVKKSPG